MAGEPRPGTQTHQQKKNFKERQIQAIKHRNASKTKTNLEMETHTKHKECRAITEKNGKENSQKLNSKEINNQRLDQ